MRTRRCLSALLLVTVAGCAAAPAGSTAPPTPQAEPPRVATTTLPPSVAAPAASQVVPRRPALAVLPDGTRMPVDVAGTTPAGALRVPDDVTRAGWWRGGSRLGDGFGSVVLAAHVDSRTQGLGPAASLLGAAPGDVLLLVAGRHRQRFVVVSVTRVARDRLRERVDLFSARGPLRLVFLTCGGPFDPLRGYRDNVVVVARRTG
ncbi:class F sortase [Nocardioides iriomotensis]|uniref:Class F sortase n=1 Tax=Nocardioides iriomotensis TaxID=715784 RepID=A0A4Q5ITV6_9ACTN|nr:class F sortase [Nocardioides iriomotensis]RYU09264.1 class F sortase [Nocardioides iriomotensis]